MFSIYPEKQWVRSVGISKFRLRDAREFSRLRAAVYDARTDQEAAAAPKKLDDYVEHVARKYGTPGEKERQTRKKSRSLRIRL